MFVVLVTFFIEVRVLFVDDVFVMLHTVIDLVGIVIDTFVNFPMVVTDTFFEEVFGVGNPDRGEEACDEQWRNEQRFKRLHVVLRCECQ